MFFIFVDFLMILWFNAIETKSFSNGKNKNIHCFSFIFCDNG